MSTLGRNFNCCTALGKSLVSAPSHLLRSTLTRAGCMIKIFRGEGVVDGEGGSSERCLKWGGEGWWVVKGSFQKHLKTRGG